MAITPDFLTSIGSIIRSIVAPQDLGAAVDVGSEPSALEQDALLLGDKRPAKAADLDQLSEYRLAHLMQFPFN